MTRFPAARRMLAVPVLLLVAVGAAACSGASSAPPAGATNVPPATSAASAAAGSPAAGNPAAGNPAAGSPAAGSPADPCVLVTAADAQAALGGPVDPSTSSFTGIYQSCAYATASGQNVIITTRTIDRAGFDAAVAEGPGVTPVPLPGMCQDAYVISADVWAWQNGTEVDARVVGTVDLLPAAKQLITLACSRL